MTVKDDRDFVLHQQSVNRHIPARPVLLESVASVFVLATPFKESGSLSAASLRRPLIGVFYGIASNKMMNKNELEFGFARFQGFLKPLILLLTDSPVPADIFLAT